MKEFIVLTDSTCDLPKELRQQYGIEYVAMQYVVDGTEYAASLDWESHGAKEYYDLMRNGTRVFTTQVPKNVYYDAFRKAVESGKAGRESYREWLLQMQSQKIIKEALDGND